MSTVTVSILQNLFDHLALGLVVLDASGRVVIYNTAEEALAGRTRDAVLGRDFFTEVAPCMNVRSLGGEFREKIGKELLSVNVEFEFPFPFLNEPRDVHVRMTSFAVDGQPHGLLTIQDVSFQRSVDRMREQLQSLLIHDLKNPLSAIAANLDFLDGLPAIRDAQDAREAINDSMLAASQLQSMLLNLLDITRLETNTLPLQRKPCEVTRLLEDAAAGARRQARGMNVEISVAATTDTAPSLSLIDAGVIRRALDNLLSNAIRFARRIELASARVGTTTILEVRDDGPGVPEALRKAVFEKHIQVAEHAKKQASHNRGLGLTFVRLAARAHGGDATVESRPTGGSIFRLSLPEQVGSVA